MTHGSLTNAVRRALCSRSLSLAQPRARSGRAAKLQWKRDAKLQRAWQRLSSRGGFHGATGHTIHGSEAWQRRQRMAGPGRPAATRGRLAANAASRCALQRQIKPYPIITQSGTHPAPPSLSLSSTPRAIISSILPAVSSLLRLASLGGWSKLTAHLAAISTCLRSTREITFRHHHLPLRLPLSFGDPRQFAARIRLSLLQLALAGLIGSNSTCAAPG